MLACSSDRMIPHLGNPLRIERMYAGTLTGYSTPVRRYPARIQAELESIARIETAKGCPLYSSHDADSASAFRQRNSRFRRFRPA